MPKYEKCPQCGERTLVYDEVKQEAYCRRSVCNFKQETGDKVTFDKAFS